VRPVFGRGLRLVEIDYLHERRPIDPRLPTYPSNPDSYPYYILVSDPRPTYFSGKTAFYGFGVMDALPVIDVPLSDEDVV